MASIHRKKLRSGRVVWELTHGKGVNRVRFVAGDTKEAAEGVLAQFNRQIATHGAAPTAQSIELAFSEFGQHLDLNRRHGTARRYKRVLKTFALYLAEFQPAINRLREVKPGHVEDYKRQRRAGR